jgi:hypothetical protein
MEKIGWGHFKIFLSRINAPDKLKFIGESHDIMQFQVCTNHGPMGSKGTATGKTVIHVFIIKICKKLFYLFCLVMEYQPKKITENCIIPSSAYCKV